jgi:hypothetical protein
MSRALGFTKKVLFRLRWSVMSQERRYACLWTRTKRHLSHSEAPLQSANE